MNEKQLLKDYVIKRINVEELEKHLVDLKKLPIKEIIK